MADTASQHPELTWQAPEFEHRPKTPRWYWTSIGIAIALLALSIWQANYFFGLFIVIAELMIIVWGATEPPMVTFKLDRRGLTIGPRTFYPFTDIKSWSADEHGVLDPVWPDILLHLKSHFQVGVRIKVPHALLPEVQAVFRAHKQIEEVVFEPSFIDLLEKLLGF